MSVLYWKHLDDSFFNVGAVPAGQWEWSWASQHAQIPNFPQDYPDTNSGLEYDMLRSANDASERRLRPKGKYPEAIIMNWNSIGSGTTQFQSMTLPQEI